MKSRLVTITDVILIIFFLVVGVGSGVLLWRKPAPARFCVIQSSRQVEMIPLSRDTVLVVFGPVGKTTVEVKSRRVRVRDSECHDKICVRMGWIGYGGQMIACAPNRVIVRITGGAFDAVTR